MGAFGVRNFDTFRAAWLRHSTSRPGGQILVLDFCEPAVPLFKQYICLLSQYLPLIGLFGTATGLRHLHTRSATSAGSAFVQLLKGAGFVESSATTLTMGICSIMGRKE